MKCPENFVKALKDKMEKPYKPELEWVDEPWESKAVVPETTLEYVEKVLKFRRGLESGGCPLCGSPIETAKSKFWFLEWDFWKCTDKDGLSCPMSIEFNSVFKTYAKFKEEDVQNDATADSVSEK